MTTRYDGHRAELVLRLRAHATVRGRLEDVGGLAWLLSAVAAERPSARIELRDAASVRSLDVASAEVVDATLTTADGELVRGASAASLEQAEGDFEILELARVRRSIAIAIVPLRADADRRRVARAADVTVAALALAAGTAAAVLGMISHDGSLGDEARALSALPDLTWENVIEGEVTRAFEPYLADRFRLRGALLDVDGAMRRARGLAPDEEDVVVYSVAPEAVDLGADPDLDLDDSDPLVSTTAVEPEVIAPEPEERSSGPTRVLAAGILIRDGRAMQSFAGEASGAPGYARMINEMHAAFGDRATVYSVIVPTAQEFYLPSGSRSRVRAERPNILGTYARLAEGIRTVDVHAELARHAGENVYFRTDHHWTGLGAYYGYRAFCAAADLTPVPLDDMERRVVARRWMGSLYRITRDPDLRADEVEIAVPPARAEVRVGERVVPLFRDDYAGYTTFLGGDYPLMRVRTSTENGRRAILVKNSYGNAFAVYLVSHYEELVFIDYRTFRGSLRGLLEESELPTDLIFMNGTLTANSRTHTALIQRLLDARG